MIQSNSIMLSYALITEPKKSLFIEREDESIPGSLKDQVKLVTKHVKRMLTIEIKELPPTIQS